MQATLLLGRILYSMIFLLASIGHFSKGVIQYASEQGVPAATWLVPLSGIILILGAVSIILGYKARIGAWLLVIFLIPVTLTMHRFWNITDPVLLAVQQAMFMKNLALLGAALMIAYFGSGPLSIDRSSSL